MKTLIVAITCLLSCAFFCNSMYAQPPVRQLQTLWELYQPSEVPTGENEAWGLTADGLALWWVTNPDVAGLGDFRDIVIHTVDFDGIIRDTAYTTIGGAFNQQGYHAVISGSRIYVCGRTCRSLALDLRDCDMIVICINRATGDTLWTRTIDGGNGYDEADGMSIQPNGDILVTGWMDGGATKWDAGIVRLSPDGEVLWKKTWGGAKNDHQDGHLVTVRGETFGAGLYDGSVNDLITLRGFEGRSSVFRIDPENGNITDSMLYGRVDPYLNFENALGIAADSEEIFTTGITTVSENNNDLFVSRFNKTLDQQWTYTCCGPGTEAARAIEVAAFGQVVVVGQTTSFGAGGIDVVVVMLNYDGTEQRRLVWGGPGDDEPLDCIIRNNTLYITGRTSSPRGNHKDAFLIASFIFHTDVEEDAEHKSFEVTSANGVITLRPTNGPVHIEVWNILGELVYSNELSGATQINVNAGSYFIRSTDAFGKTSTGKVASFRL